MGQAYSKTNSRKAHQPANSSQYALHQAISYPEPPRRLTHISELINIDQLMRQGVIPSDTLDTLCTKDLPIDDELSPSISIWLYFISSAVLGQARSRNGSRRKKKSHPI